MPANRAEMYREIRERAAKGDYTLIDPLDYLILGALHDEGEMFAGLYPLATTTGQLSKDTLGGKVPATIIGPRMNSMTIQGLVVQVMVPGNLGKNAYQRTKAGKKVHDEWSRRNGDKPSPTAEV